MEIHQDIIRRSVIAPLGEENRDTVSKLRAALRYGDLELAEARNNLLVRS
jgi:hypothetical protein